MPDKTLQEQISLDRIRWNTIFHNRDEEEYKNFVYVRYGNPDDGVVKVLDYFFPRGTKRILDLGCGSGRHSLYLAQQGFEVYGLDLSEEGINKAAQAFSENNLESHFVLGSMYDPLPWEDNFFDGFISTRAIHHNYIEIVRKAIGEVRRVVKPGGIILITCPTPVTRLGDNRRPSNKVAPHTIVPTDGKEVGVVHFVFNKTLIRKEFKGFKELELWVQDGEYLNFIGENKKK